MLLKLDKKKLSFIIIFFIAFIYILFPSINTTGDSFGYAKDIAMGKELFHSHHILFNAFLYLPVKIFNIHNTLSYICIMNAIFAIAALLIVNNILLKRKEEIPHIAFLLILAASFGFMRYATSAETYIIPLFFTLLASKFVLAKNSYFLAGLFASIACLFHQISVFWWIGLLFYIIVVNKKKRLKAIIQYALVTVIVPIIYLIVFIFTKNDSSSIIDFVLHDYTHYEDVKIFFSFKALLLTVINFFRSFAQFHGYFIPMIQKYPFIIAFVAFSLSLFVFACIKIKNISIKKNKDFNEKLYGLTHLLIFFIQLFFAFLSNGNAEFMVMIPFTIILFLSFYFSIKGKTAILLASALLIWNLSLELFPAHFIELNSSAAIIRYVEKHPQEKYYIKKGQTIRNGIEYKNKNKKYNIISVKSDNEILESIVNEGSFLITDLFNKENISRASFIFKERKLPNNYSISNYDTINYDLGQIILSKIEKKQFFYENKK